MATVQLHSALRSLALAQAGAALSDAELLEGRPAMITSGGQYPLVNKATHSVEYIDVGISVKMMVHCLDDGRLRVDATLEQLDVEKPDKSDVRLRGQSVRRIAVVRPATSQEDMKNVLKLESRNDQGEVDSWALIRVHPAEPLVQSR